jgi:hypothetical protein
MRNKRSDGADTVQWYNEPETWDADDNHLSVTAKKTDFWRVTVHDFIKDDGHFYYQSVRGDFTVTVKVTGKYVSQYDQAGLMVREDSNTWMKCGIEWLDGVQQASAVITRDFSDWSIVPLPDNPQSIWIQVKRLKSAVEVCFSRDGENYLLIRQGYLTEVDTVQVGMMCASPTKAGLVVDFDDYVLVQ